MALTVGSPAPDFKLKATGNQEMTLSSYRGKQPVLLLFYPLAFSPVCTAELCWVRDSYDRFKKLNAQVLAVSVDSPYVQEAWAKNEEFPFPLLSDFNKEVARAYSALHDDLAGLKGVAKRSAFVIDKKGTIRYAWVSNDPKKLPDFDAIEKTLEAAA